LSHAPRTAGSRSDLACALKVCPLCLGDLVAHNDATGSYFLCLQCDQRVDRARRPVLDQASRLSTLVLPAAPIAAPAGTLAVQ